LGIVIDIVYLVIDNIINIEVKKMNKKINGIKYIPKNKSKSFSAVPKNKKGMVSKLVDNSSGYDGGWFWR